MEHQHSKQLKCVKFHIKAEPESEVFLSGSFNHWNGNAIKMTDVVGNGDFYKMLMLPSGNYEYKFVINGHYQNDPNCPDCVANDFGTSNNIINVD